MQQPDNDLVLKFSQGDRDAFTAIYHTYYPVLYGYIKKIVLEREDAEDIAADIFVRLWSKHAAFGHIRNIEAFLFVTARNACLDFLRHVQRRNSRQKELFETLLRESNETSFPDDIRTEVLRSILAEIEKLPVSCRKVFQMSFLEGLSNAAIAEALHINNQSVRNHKQRAIKYLRLALLNRNMLAGVWIGLYCTMFRFLG